VANTMEQIARDMREGTFPKKSVATLSEEIVVLKAKNDRLLVALAQIIEVPTGYHAAAQMEAIARAARSQS
jgi:hypothetical protein